MEFITYRNRIALKTDLWESPASQEVVLEDVLLFRNYIIMIIPILEVQYFFALVFRAKL